MAEKVRDRFDFAPSKNGGLRRTTGPGCRLADSRARIFLLAILPVLLYQILAPLGERESLVSSTANKARLRGGGCLCTISRAADLQGSCVLPAPKAHADQQSAGDQAYEYLHPRISLRPV
jgi:hypothetical protein